MLVSRDRETMQMLPG